MKLFIIADCFGGVADGTGSVVDISEGVFCVARSTGDFKDLAVDLVGDKVKMFNIYGVYLETPLRCSGTKFGGSNYCESNLRSAICFVKLRSLSWLSSTCIAWIKLRVLSRLEESL